MTPDKTVYSGYRNEWAINNELIDKKKDDRKADYRSSKDDIERSYLAAHALKRRSNSSP